MMDRHSWRPSRLLQLVSRQQRQGAQINGKPNQHADASRGKAVVPSRLFAERAADQRRQERADIDADIKDRICAVAAVVARGIKAANLGRDIGFERAIAENQRQQRQQKKLLDRHHEMADRHQGGADDDGATLAEYPVGK
jgi:hypothetical protein